MGQAFDSNLTAMSPQVLLRALAAHANPQHVTLLLRSGAALQGVPRKVADDGATLVFAEGENLVFLALAEVVGVTIHDPRAIAPILTGGAVPQRSAEPAPTRLELRRQIEARQPGGATKLAIDWQAVPAGDDASLNVRALAFAIFDALAAATGDALGKSAVQTVTSVHVVHRAGTALHATREGAAISFAFDLTRALPDDLDRAVGAQLNSLL